MKSNKYEYKMSSSAITNWREEDKPREKLIAKGVDALTDAELLAIILRTGTRNLNALEIAKIILSKFPSLWGIYNAREDMITEIPGIEKAKLAMIKAALELGRRMTNENVPLPKLFDKPEDVYKYLQPQFQGKPIEIFKVLVLDSKNQLIIDINAFQGSVTSSNVYVREIFNLILKNYGVSFIISHNHPSGKAFPSNDDIQLTFNLVQAGILMNIPLIDHIIVGKNEYFSFMTEKLISKYRQDSKLNCNDNLDKVADILYR